MNTLSTFIFSAIQQLVAGNTLFRQEGVPEGTAQGSTEKLGDQLQDHAAEVAETLNQSEAVQEVSAGILQPIFDIAQYMDFPSFYWVAFALMIAGVVSFAGQLVLSKFFLLFKASLNIREIISDLFCLVISIVGLVLTTQAASGHSTFTESSMSVVSATAVGVLLGIVFYWWGQKTEFQAARRIPQEEA